MTAHTNTKDPVYSRFAWTDVEDAISFECRLQTVDKIAKAADGMPIEFCRGAIGYFNQF